MAQSENLCNLAATDQGLQNCCSALTNSLLTNPLSLIWIPEAYTPVGNIHRAVNLKNGFVLLHI